MGVGWSTLRAAPVHVGGGISFIVHSLDPQKRYCAQKRPSGKWHPRKDQAHTFRGGTALGQRQPAGFGPSFRVKPATPPTRPEGSEAPIISPPFASALV